MVSHLNSKTVQLSEQALWLNELMTKKLFIAFPSILVTAASISYIGVFLTKRQYLLIQDQAQIQTGKNSEEQITWYAKYTVLPVPSLLKSNYEC